MIYTCLIRRQSEISKLVAVIDEQHRFGVEQRSKLWKKKKFRHIFW
jgi:RecG-like helicase